MYLREPENYSARLAFAHDFEEQGRNEIALKEALDTRVYQGDSGRDHSTLIFNQDYRGSAEHVIVADGQFLGSTLLPEDKYKGFLLAAAFPDTPILLRDFGGHGNSSPHDLGQLKEAFIKRTITGDADDWAEITRQIAPNVKSQSIFAISLAALEAPRYIKRSLELDVATRHLVGFEAVGTDKKSPPRLMKNFFIDETKLQKMYKGDEAIHDEGLNELYEKEFKDNLEAVRVAEGIAPETYGLYSIYKRDPAIVAAMLLRSPLATNRFFRSMLEAMKTQPDLHATFCLGGLSKVNRRSRVEGGYSVLKQVYPDRFDYQVWPQDSHGMGLAPQTPRLVQFFKDAILL